VGQPMKVPDNRFGINMIRFIAGHETSVRARLDNPADLDADWPALLDEHLVKIAWLQHERLVHLLVTILAAILLMFLYGLLLLAFNVLILVLLGVVAVLLAAYIFHYFRLENSVQRWYLLADEIRRKI
jgi:hypothetical protein